MKIVESVCIQVVWVLLALQLIACFTLNLEVAEILHKCTVGTWIIWLFTRSCRLEFELDELKRQR